MTHEETPAILFHRPCWAEINLSAFQRNWQTLRAVLPAETSVMAVVKANAYGHGLIPLSQTASTCGAAYLGVSSLEEGLALRQAKIATPILILGSLFPFENFPLLFEHRLTPTIASLIMAEALSRLAVERGEKIAVHMEVDTGMGRTGVMPGTALELLHAVSKLPGLVLEGLYTHLASSDADPEFTQQQVTLFRALVQKAAAENIRPQWIHWGNSAAVFSDPAQQPSLVRPGLSLYGVPPFAKMPSAEKLEPVLRWKTRVIFLKTVPAGASVSYARTWTARRNSRVATLAVGYADGLQRVLSNRGEVLIHGRRAPILGRVTMDMTMVDVTDIAECVVGDEVVLIGSQGAASISAVELADWAGTNPYEILCAISARVPRVVTHA
jgi:alanine racemase